MALIRSVLAGCGVLALIAVSAAPAMADPPKGVTPRASDVVGTGSDTIGFLLDQFSHDFNKAHPGAKTLLYSWDPVNPVTGATGDPIQAKAGCKPIARPDGSSPGIAALEANTTDPADPKAFCADYAGSSRGPQAGDPGCAAHGICFVPIADDAVTWAARDKASGGTDAPASLTRSQLRSIYLCQVTNWAKVGGKNAPIKPFLPQPGSGTRAFWLLTLGGGTPITPGSCVSDDHGTLQDNQGISPVLDRPGAIYPYSVAGYIAQAYHSARCADASCTGTPPCVPRAGQNLFGCDVHGVLGLHEISGSKPVTTWPPPPKPCPSCAINPKFDPVFQRIVYVVVRDGPAPGDIPAYLKGLFGPKNTGYVCTSPTASTDITAYGFLTLPVTWDQADGVNAVIECGVPHWDPRRR